MRTSQAPLCQGPSAPFYSGENGEEAPKLCLRNDFNITIRSHGCETNGFTEEALNRSLLQNLVSSAIDFVEKSNICPGFPLQTGESVVAMVPHISGRYKDITTSKEETRVFSSKCTVLALVGGRCHECSTLLKWNNERKQRKANQSSIHPFRNKRYLNKEEMSWQLVQERRTKVNAQKREKYWRDKFVREAIELADADHQDVVALYEDVSCVKGPIDTACLPAHQQLVVTTPGADLAEIAPLTRAVK